MSAKAQSLRKRVNSEAQAHMKSVRARFIRTYIDKKEVKKQN